MEAAEASGREPSSSITQATAQMDPPPKPTPTGLCAKCNKPLVPVGQARKGGRAHADWHSRKYHKQCWLALKRSGELSDDDEPTPKRPRGAAAPAPPLAAFYAPRAPNCKCGVKAAHKTSRTEKNPNREFYTCGAGRNCGFFEWCPTPNAPAAAAAAPPPRAQANLGGRFDAAASSSSSSSSPPAAAAACTSGCSTRR